MRHPHRNRKLRSKHRRTYAYYAPSPQSEYNELKERRIRTARHCLVALTLVLLALGVACCIFR